MVMIKRAIFGLLLLSLSLVSPCEADSAVQCELQVYQIDSVSGQNVSIMTDTVLLVEGMASSAFVVAFSVDLEVELIDSVGIQFTAHVVTTGQEVSNFSRKYSVEFNLPARIGPVVAKKGATYGLQLVPLESTDVDRSYCSMDHREKGVFAVSPSANLDIFYLPASLGEIYWASVKGLMEFEYRRFQSRFNLSLPGKYMLFLCPCAVNSVIWDHRFGLAIDPTRKTVFAMYSKEYNTADPFVMNHAAVLRSFGYAPAILSEGFASYYSAGLFDLKQMKAADGLPSLSDLLTPGRYHAFDAGMADRYSGVFVRFLIDQFGDGPFRKAYRGAHDLNLAEKLTEMCGVSIAELDQQFQTYVDTTQPTSEELAELAAKAETMMNYKLMLPYAEGLLARSGSWADSTQALSVLTRAYFLTGNYYKATEVQEASLVLDSSKSNNWMILGNYKMINGLYVEGLADLEYARSMAPQDQTVQYNIASGLHYSGRSDEAIEILSDIIAAQVKYGLPGEARVLLGQILQQRHQEGDSARADQLFIEAINIFNPISQGNPSSAAAQLWLGLSYLGKRDLGNAYDYITLADFMETRPLYLGITKLSLGKLADLTGQREAALVYYNQVVGITSAVYHQDEARRYLEEPYTQ